MRRFALAIASCLLTATLPASAHASADIVGAPISHGPDPAAVAAGPEAPAPTGGAFSPDGKPRVIAASTVHKVLPSNWCGAERNADDTADETRNGDFKEHAVYMIPADGRDRFSQFATAIQTDAF